MENLPPDVQPTALLRLYARIANLIVATWRDPKAFGAYMDSLLHDKRGNRRGYSSEVDAELVTLKRPHDVGRQVSINGCYERVALRLQLAGTRPSASAVAASQLGVTPRSAQRSSASSTSMPRYLTVLSSSVCPSSNWTARRFLVRR